jgi:hypothetical protein
VSGINHHLDDDDENVYNKLPQSTRTWFAYGPVTAIQKREDLLEAGTCMFFSKLVKQVTLRFPRLTR